jgi:hypothetical protein
LKSRTEFNTDREYQDYYDQWFKKNKLDDGYSYVISLDTGFIEKKEKMQVTPVKISKSSQNNDV